MFGISLEHLIILGIIVLVFGPKRLPVVGSSLKKAVQNFKDGWEGVREARFRKLKDGDENRNKKKDDAPNE